MEVIIFRSCLKSDVPEVLGGLRPEVLVNQATLGNQYPPAKKKKHSEDI